MLYPALITEALSAVRYPGSGKSLTGLDMIADDIRIDGNRSELHAHLRQTTDPFRASVLKSAEAAIKFREPEAEVTIAPPSVRDKRPHQSPGIAGC